MLRRLVPIGVCLVVMVAGIVVGHQLGPFFLRSDPDYAYLFNGLGVLQGQLPGHIDHPGTTLQELAAVTIGLKYLAGLAIGVRETVAKSVLSQPEDYLRTIQYVLLGLNALVIAIAVRQVISRTGSVWLSLFIPVLIMLSPTTLYSLGTVRPEQLLITFAVPVVLLAMPPVQSKGRSLLWRGVWMGLALGAGIVTKVTFVPLAMFILALPGIGSMALAAISAIFAIVLLTTPIWIHFADQNVWIDKLIWLGHLVTHQGIYGSGEAGLPPASQLWDNTVLLLKGEPQAVLAMTLFGVVALALRRVDGEQQRSWQRVLLIGLAVVMCQFATTAPRPIPHYLAPCLVVLAVLAPMALAVRFPNAGKHVGAAAIGGLVAWYGAALLPNLSHPRQAFHSSENLVRIAEQQNCRVIPYYLYGSVEYALNFGDGYMRQSYARDLTELYPGYVEYNFFADRLLNLYAQDVAAEANASIEAGDALCLIGTVPLTSAQQTQVTLIAQDGNYYLYRARLFY